MPNLAKLFGINLKRLRSAAGLRQEDLAMLVWPDRDAKVGKIQISKYERGVQYPREDIQSRLTKALGVSVLDFFVGSDSLHLTLSGIQVGDNIKELRADLSIEELASRSHIPVENMREYERGSIIPSRNILQRIANALGVDISYFTISYSNKVACGIDLQKGVEIISDGGAEEIDIIKEISSNIHREYNKPQGKIGDINDFYSYFNTRLMQIAQGTMHIASELQKELKKLKKENKFLKELLEQHGIGYEPPKRPSKPSN
ncbi:MAG: helix-turn-helix domain-containing protein [Pseudomonadota bacterium]